ncbi:HK97-gp10 family putative phage morphogenesis protein [Roseateles asaccharophilus]|uniref:HK97 gp10 family phage protein n=1 Tax=Roseateles asaccharophilus TaxID=582607 RepID=A0ABU2A3J1_9BURK|nr:HK97-gp10 family putative phage morphogenesis protein [Roseateles asaccharophilus]MDR7331762.1 HK97 gp10 family phage protein [Roseateles asaccharophilus]
MSETKVKGLAELKAALAQLPEKIERNIMRGAIRAGLKPLKEQAAANIRSVSGQLADSVRVGTKTKKGAVIGTVTAGVSKKNKRPYYAHMVEFGTKRHIIKARRGKLLAIGVAKVDHPGARPKPFMRPALDATQAQVLEGVREYVRTRLATKHGIDVPAPLAEGDEP